MGIGLGLVGLSLAGCTPFVPGSDYVATGDVAYGEGARRRLDVYRPKGPSGLAERAPVVIFFYGGRWNSGAKGDYRFAGEAFASRGFLTVVPDTRLSPEVAYPGFVEDSAQAVRWTIDHAAEYGGDPSRVYLVGHSAGAYNAMMLALDERWLQAVGVDNHEAIAGVVGLAGPYDIAPFEDADLQALFGPPEGWPATQPINHADGRDPPVLLLQGEADDVVKPGNAPRLAAKLNDAGGHAEVKLYPGVDHYRIVGALSAPLRGLAPVLDDATTYLRAHGGTP
jgi:acetyl esterase/lipase